LPPQKINPLPTATQTKNADAMAAAAADLK